MPEDTLEDPGNMQDTLTLAAEEISRLFPAYLKLSEDGKIRDAGPSLLRHKGPGLLGQALHDAVSFELPAKNCDIDDLRKHRRAIILRLNSGTTLRLRGLVLDRGEAIWLMLGHIPDLDLGEETQPLRIADFSPTDGTLDMMLAAEMQSGLLTETRALAAALDVQRNQAEAANRAKSAFLTTMSHEIRTPMNAVLGVASILAETDISKEQREWLDVMVDSGQSLMGLLNNILDLSKIESGAMGINPEEFDLRALGKSVHGLYAPTAAAKGVKAELEMALEGTIYLGDSVRIRQIMSNLVGNATKFTEAGKIVLSLHDRIEGEARQLYVSVKDTGIGISAEAIERLFNVFSQADSSTTRRYGGTGLGLSISRLLCEQMGGEITVESRLGRGSTFTARIPIELVAQPDQTAVPQDNEPTLALVGPRHVLIVDDNATNRKILSHYLRRLGHSFDVAVNGQQALVAWEEHDYDVIIMDIEMPVLDGLEATRELRRREIASMRDYTPIIALSADAMVEKREMALSIGMDDYLTKPVGLGEIDARIRVVCARNEQTLHAETQDTR
ncbi:MAG: ATP-binding protein [Roseinatronobacter sp.]